MKFGVLGTLTASLDDGTVVDLGPLRYRTVLAALLVDAGRTVATSLIVDRVWGDTARPGTAAGLHTIISRIRARTGPGVILTSAPGYRLAVGAEDLDALRFTALLGRARTLSAGNSTAAALDVVNAALDLWRGEAYADLPATFAQQAAADLADQQMAAFGLLAELGLASGQHSEVAATLAPVVRRSPLREDLRASLMIALCRSGRQADALQVFDDGRIALARELGIDPGRTLRTVHQAILRQEVGLSVDIHLPASTRARPGNNALPVRHRSPRVALTPIIGRDGDVDAVLELLRTRRLVTVIGTGGMGKSRLAVEVLSRITGGDGPWLVELADLNDGTLMAETVAGSLGLPACSTTDALARILMDRSTVLILDNCEHIVPEVAEFAVELLRWCPGLTIMTTSREVLGVPDETVFTLHPLADSAARMLFVLRARAAHHGWTASPEDEPVLAGICRRLDNLPLALEMAAAQSRLLSVSQLAGLLDRGLAVLHRSGKPERHATIRAVVAWSYERLNNRERLVFHSLAVLEGTFDLETATAATGLADVVPAIGSLIDKSLLVVVDRDPRRYRMLETLRQYAAMVREDATTSAVRGRVVQRFDTLTEDVESGLRGPEEATWMRLLAEDHATLRALLDWSDVDPASQLRIAIAISWFWYVSGHIAFGVKALERLLAAADPRTPTDLLLRGRIGQTLLAYLAGQLPAALQHLSQAEDLVRAAAVSGSTSHQNTKAYALAVISYFHAALGHTEAALASGEESLAIARSIQSDPRAADAQQSLGMAYFRARRLAEAEQVLLSARSSAERAGYRWCAGSVGWILAKVRISAGHLSASNIGDLIKVIDGCAAHGDITSWLVTLDTLAFMLFRRDRITYAAELSGITHTWGRRIGFSPQEMDPVDLTAYQAEMRPSFETEVWQVAYEHGAAQSMDAAALTVNSILTAARSLERVV